MKQSLAKRLRKARNPRKRLQFGLLHAKNVETVIDKTREQQAKRKTESEDKPKKKSNKNLNLLRLPPVIRQVPSVIDTVTGEEGKKTVTEREESRFSIPFTTMKAFCKDILEELTDSEDKCGPYYLTDASVFALQEASEDLLIKLFSEAGMCMTHRTGTAGGNLIPDDMLLPYFLGGYFDKWGEPNKSVVLTKQHFQMRLHLVKRRRHVTGFYKRWY